MLKVILIVAGLLLLSIPFAWLSIGEALKDLPQRFLDRLREGKERRERKRTEKARNQQPKELLEWVRKDDI